MDDEITAGELRSLLDGDDPDPDGSDTDADAADGVDAGDENDDGSEADLRIVDIRNPGPFRRGHIPGSENIPAPELTGRVEELDGAGRIVTVCPHGEASVQAARLIASYEGVDGPVESLAGGLDAWDGPLVSDGGEDAGVDADTDPDDGQPTAPF